MTTLLAATLALTLTACAAGRIRTPDGTVLAGIALGHAALVHCTGGVSDVGPTEPVCTRLEGGTLSASFADVFGVLVAAVAAYFSGGVF